MHLLKGLLACLVLAVATPAIGAALPLDSRRPGAHHVLERRTPDWRQRLDRMGQWFRGRSSMSNQRPTTSRPRANTDVLGRLQRLSAVLSFERYVQTLPEDVQKMYRDCLKRNGVTESSKLPVPDQISIQLRCKEELEPVWGPHYRYFKNAQDEFVLRDGPNEEGDEKKGGGSRNQFSDLSQEVGKLLPGAMQPYFSRPQRPGAPVSERGGLHWSPGVRKGF